MYIQLPQKRKEEKPYIFLFVQQIENCLYFPHLSFMFFFLVVLFSNYGFEWLIFCTYANQYGRDQSKIVFVIIKESVCFWTYENDEERKLKGTY